MRMRLLLLGAMLACSAGCSRFSAPRVSVNEVSVIDATEDALALSFVMGLQNPNQAAVPLHEFRYTVAINGKEVYAGRRAGGVHAERCGHQAGSAARRRTV